MDGKGVGLGIDYQSLEIEVYCFQNLKLFTMHQTSRHMRNSEKTSEKLGLTQPIVFSMNFT